MTHRVVVRHVSNSDGENKIEISTASADPDPIHNATPTWSTDGSRVAWSGTDATGHGQIYAANSDGTERIEVSTVAPGNGSDSNNGPALVT